MVFSFKNSSKITSFYITIFLLSLVTIQSVNYSNFDINGSTDQNDSIEIRPLREKPNFSLSEPVMTSYVEVNVFDGITSLPLVAANVEVIDQTTGARIKSGITDKQGFLNITNLYVGIFKVEIDGPVGASYRSDSHIINIDILGETRSLKVFLMPTSSIEGVIETTILDINGKPIVDIDVEITNIEEVVVSSEVTNESGITVTKEPLDIGTYEIRVSANGYYESTKSVSISWHGEYKKVTITLLPKGTSSATVEISTRDGIKGENISSVNLEIFDTIGESIWTGTTDEDGYTIFSKLDVGTFRITANYDTYNEEEKEFIIRYPGDYKKLSFHLFPTSSNLGFIEVKVLSESSSPISGASINLYNKKNQVISTGITKDTGFYNITNLPQGSYILKVSADTYFDYEQDVTIRWNTDHKKVEVLLKSQSERGSIKVKFVDINNDPQTSVLVKLFNENKELLSTTWTKESVLKFSDLQIGKYILEGTKKGFQKITYTTDLFENKYPENREILLPSTGTGTLNLCCSTNSYISVANTRGEVIFSGMSESGELTIGSLPIGEYDISAFTDEGEQSVKDSINWLGDNHGLSLQDMIDISDNSSCMEFTIYDFNAGLVEDCRVDVITANGYSFNGYTDENGFVNITGLFLGQYEVVCHKFGYRDTILPQSIDYKGQKRICVFYIYKAYGDVYIHVSEVFSGQPQPAYVRYKRLGSDWTFLVPTDGNGQKAFHNLELGFYNFCVMVGGFETQHQDVFLAHDGMFENLHFMLTVPGGDGQVDYYALIVAGAGDQRFTHDAQEMYNVLVWYYDFDPANVYLLTPYDVDPVSGQTVYRDAVTSVLAVEWAVNEIGMKSDGDDQVVIWWTGHGGFYIDQFNQIAEGMFETYTDAIGSVSFDTLIDNIFCDHMYIFLGPCHSGYWIDDLNDEPNRAIYTSCDWDETGKAQSEHSYWPWATRRAIDPNSNAANADDDNNGKVSLWELYEWADHWVRVTQDKNQHPQRFVGLEVSYGSDLYKYLGDGTYGSPIVGTASMNQIASKTLDLQSGFSRNNLDIDNLTGIQIIQTQVEDSTFDSPQIYFEFSNASEFPEYISVPGVKVTIRNLFGSIITSGLSNSIGRITFTDIDYGLYAWEAIYDEIIIGSGQILVQEAQFISYAYSNNYDYQGDAADLKIQVDEKTQGINVQDALVTVYHADGKHIGSKLTNINGEVLFYDLQDGLYGYSVSLGEETVCAGLVNVESNDFTLESDLTPPVVKILRPLADEVYDLTDNIPKLSFSVEESNNYTVNVYLNDNKLINIVNNSLITKITISGTYKLRVEAVDNAENTGSDSIEIIVINSETTTSQSVETSISSSTSTTKAPSNGFLVLITIVSLVLFALPQRKRKKPA